jgi:hypothetical protein
MHANARAILIEALGDAHRWRDELLSDSRSWCLAVVGCGQHDERSCVAAFRLSRRHPKHILLDQLRVRPGSDRNGIA